MLDKAVDLADGQAVRIEPLPPSESTTNEIDRKQRISELKRLFETWTDEDACMTDAQADCLHQALKENRGLEFRSTKLT